MDMKVDSAKFPYFFKRPEKTNTEIFRMTWYTWGIP
jgi:hypothetical protein